VPIVVNIGVNKGSAQDIEHTVADYGRVVRVCGRYADIVELDISSPNTKGVRSHGEHLPHIVGGVRAELAVLWERYGRAPKIIVKLSPDMDRMEHQAVVQTAVESGVDGIALVNTTVFREGLGQVRWQHERGGLSGPPLFTRALERVRWTRQMAPGDMPVIGMGGITCADDAIKMLKAGANVVAVYTAFVARDPLIAWHIDRGVIAYMRHRNMQSVRDFRDDWETR
jgi:dihydroorotate dehydrogenase